MHGMIAMEYIQDAKALGYKMSRVTFQSKAFPIQVLFGCLFNYYLLMPINFQLPMQKVKNQRINN